MWWQRAESTETTPFRLDEKAKVHERIVARVIYHLVPKVHDVLNWVTHSGVVIEGQSCKLTPKLALQDFLGERRVRDFVISLFWSASELQFSLLNPSLDQLIKGSDVGRLFDYSLSLAVISFCLKTRRIGLVAVIFVEWGHRSGPPQICDGPIDPSLSNSSLAFRLRLLLGSLKSGDLRLELVIVEPRVGHCDASISLARRMMFLHQESPTPDRDLIRSIIHSYDPSCLRASKGSGFCTAVVVKHWRLPLKTRRSQCPQWHTD